MSSDPAKGTAPSAKVSSASKPKDAAEDPWHDLEIDVDAATRKMVDAREQYRQALDRVGAGEGSKGGCDWSHVAPSAAQQLDLLLSQLAQKINELEPDVQIMQDSITAALEHPERYAVPSAEMQRRQEVVQNIVRKLTKGKSEVTHGMKLREKRVAMQQEAARAAANGPGSPAAGGDVSGFMQQEYAEQHDITRKQDQALDRIHGGLLTAENKAKMIGNELDNHNKMLTDIEHDATGVQLKLDNAMTRIGTLLEKTSDRGKIGIIVCLMVILFVLVVFLFSGNGANASTSS